jgi:histidinol-phosphatase (PHP family)
MNYSCLHTHSDFCDGHDDIETMIRSAYERGFVSIGLSSHAPILGKTGIRSDWHMEDGRLEEYVETVRKARLRWAGKISVFLGLEVDYIRGLMGPADRDIRSLGLDYVIGSVHYVFPPHGTEPMTVDSPPEEFERNIRRMFDGDGEALMETYWDTLEDMIRQGGFDILGHADLIKKNNPRGRWFSTGSGGYRRRLERAASAIAASAVTVEANTGGLNRGSVPDTYPSLPFLRLLGEKKVPVVITADAHRAGDLGGHYEEARQTLLAAGYTSAAFFERTGEGGPIWREEPLGEEG